MEFITDPIRQSVAVKWEDVVIRDYRADDIDPMMDYFYQKTRPMLYNHLRPEMQPSELEWRANMLGRIRSGDFSRAVMLIVEFQGKAIGCHSLSPVHRTHADFHAHYWDLNSRGKGILPISWQKACAIFFERFGFERIFFKPPLDNPYSTKAVRRLPVRYLSEEILTDPQLQPGIRAAVYEITREEFNAL